MNKTFTFLLLVFLGLNACQSDGLDNPLDIQLRNRLNSLSPTETLDYFLLPEDGDYDQIPQDPSNPLFEEKIELGKFLFFETGLALDPKHESGRETYSCGSCHVPSACFMPGREQGIADGGINFGFNGEERTQNADYLETEMDVQGLRPLCMLNTAYVTNTTWNGRFGARDANVGTEYAWTEEKGTAVNFLGHSGLECQNVEGLRLHRLVVNKDITDSLGYTALFDQCFPEFPKEERYSLVTASFAISAYLRSLLTNKAPYQEWLRGNYDALQDQEKRGALLFYGKAQCYSCHRGPALNATEFYALGVKDLYETGVAFATGPDDPRNLGRGSFTDREEDMYKFKVPQLYNLKEAEFFFHGSSKNSLEEVVRYFNTGEPENPNVPETQIAPQLRPLQLSKEEIDDLVSFLRHGLHDPDIQRYVPDHVLSGNCIPNNDSASRIDLGCD